MKPRPKTILTPQEHTRRAEEVKAAREVVETALAQANGPRALALRARLAALVRQERYHLGRAGEPQRPSGLDFSLDEMMFQP